MSDTDFIPKERSLLYKNLRKFVRAFTYSRKTQADQTRVKLDLWMRLIEFRAHLDGGIEALETELFKEMDGRTVYKFETRNRRIKKRIDKEGNQALVIDVIHKNGDELDLVQGKHVFDFEEDENAPQTGE